MKEEKALELLKGFPDITPEIEKQMKNLLKQYIIIDHKKGICRCTHCEQVFPFSKIRQEESQHKGRTNCPECGEYVTLIQNWHNFNGSVMSDEVNCMVFLSSPKDDNLYLRCFGLRVMFEKRKLAPNIYIDEYQRYVFTEQNAARYGRNKNWYREPLAPGTYYYGFNWSEWVHRKQVTEPVFRTCHAAYQCVNIECIKDTCMRFSAVDMIKFTYPMYPITYLKFYQKNPGAERLIKCNLGYLVSNDLRDHHVPEINYKETEPHKMLGVDKQAFRAIRDGRIKYKAYLMLADKFPGKTVDTLVAYDRIINSQFGLLDRVRCGASETDVIKYLMKQDERGCGTLDIYRDYLQICRELNYDFTDKGVLYPRNLAAAHDRVVEAKAAIEAEKDRVKNIERTKRMKKMKKMRSKMEFRNGEYMVIQPESAEDIVREGKELRHCVGGYAGRHADGKLSIMFLRKIGEPDKPFYTIEVSDSYKIVQCRGYANNAEFNGGVPKPMDIKEFEKLYQAHLDEVYDKEVKSKAKAKRLKKGA